MLNPGANQYTGPACGAKKCFIAAAEAGNITTTVNKGKRAWPMNRLLLLDVYVLSRFPRYFPMHGAWTRITRFVDIRGYEISAGTLTY